MYKIIFTILAFVLTSNVAFARTCLPYSIAEALKYNGQPANWQLIDLELGKENGYYAEESFKKLGIKYEEVKEIKIPTIVATKDHAYTVIGEWRDYWITKDTMCKTVDRTCYKKKSIKAKHYYYIYAENTTR